MKKTIMQKVEALNETAAKDMLYDIIMRSYQPVGWPEVQELMEEPWFDEEAVLDATMMLGESSMYFIPLHRVV